MHFDLPGTYTVAVRCSAGAGDTACVVDTGAGATAAIPVHATNGWNDYQVFSGAVKVTAAGDHAVTVRAADPANWKPINLASVTLNRTGN